jgi:uncharacterized protein (TIGR01244 family)
MNVMPLTDEFAVTAQISVDDVSAIAEAGYKTIICNRPDYETADQPVFADIKAAAEAAGLTVAYIPVVGMPTPNQVAEMADSLKALPQPVLAYCRSGNRSSILFNAAQG